MLKIVSFLGKCGPKYLNWLEILMAVLLYWCFIFVNSRCLHRFWRSWKRCILCIRILYSQWTSFVWIELGEDDVKLRREQWQALRRKSGLWELDNSYCPHGWALLGEINHVSYFGDVCEGCWRVSEIRTSHGQGHLWLNWKFVTIGIETGCLLSNA